MTDQVGRVLGERYRLIAPIGAGASAQVYLAEDVSLRREVAVKLLHEGLVDDPRFLERFRAEAQATASLNHQHLVAVYDWGFDDVPYLVTEYLAGGSLRQILDQGYLLTTSQVLLLGLEASRALEYAHRRGLIHRDIKPSNLLFDEDGRMRIADFGLARALAEAAITDPTGGLMGTARYAAPEQAQGQTVDGKADIYALGLVLVEAATGEVPFTADTSVGTLMARVDQPIPVPEALGVLRGAVARCGGIEPESRPDAGELAVSLMAAAESLPRPEPLPLVGAVVPNAFDPDPTDLGINPLSTAATGAGISAGAAGSLIDDSYVDDAATLEQYGEPTIVFNPGDPPPAEVFENSLASPPAIADAPSRKRSRRRERARSDDEEAAPVIADPIEEDDGSGSPIAWAFTGLLLLAGIVLGAWLFWRSAGTPTHVVPNVVGAQYDDLAPVIGEYAWEVTRLEGRLDGSETGAIISQSPEEGTLLEEGEELRVTVSLGNSMVTIPTGLEGISESDAAVRLGAFGLSVGDVTVENAENLAPGLIVRVDEPVLEVPRGQSINLVVSDGPEPRTVPDDLVLGTGEDAVAILEEMRLVAEVSNRYDDDVPAGQVISLSPSPSSQVPVGTTIGVVVSDGPAPIEVPDVTGFELADAVEELQEAGLCIGETEGPADDRVRLTDPPAGDFVDFAEDCDDPTATAIVIVTAEPDEEEESAEDE